MKGWLIHLILSIVVLLVLASNLCAQELTDLELNLYVAGNSHTKSDFQIGYPQSITPIPSEFKLGDSLSGGMHFNVNTTRHWGEEFLYSFEPNKVRFTRNGPVVSTLDLPIRIMNIAANAMYYFTEDTESKVRPFITFGGGVDIFQPTSAAVAFANNPLGGNLPGFGTSPEISANAGVGYKIALNHAVGFRMDFRGFINRNPSFGLPRSSSNPSATVFPATGSMESFEVSGGVYFRFRK